MSDYTNESTLCLCGADARPFMRQPVGKKLTLTLDVVITKQAVEPVDPTSDQKQPVVELSINNIRTANKAYADMTTGEIDQEIQDIKEGRPESIWTEQKKLEKVREAPFDNREGKFVYR